jgi:formylglycine-generating enzyme required for sulfatase activity
MPGAEELPEALRPLTRRQAFPLTARHWTNDVAQLVQALKRAPGVADDRKLYDDIAREQGQQESKRGEPEEHAVTDDEARPGVADEQVKKGADEEARRKAEAEARRRGEEEAQRVKPVQAPAYRWKVLAGIGAIIGIAALAVFFGIERRAFRDCDHCPEMVTVPAGHFAMGSPDGEGNVAEKPQHAVAFAREFAVGKYEVTFDEWDACVAAGGCKHRAVDGGRGRGKLPVINVNWEDAQAYVAWLSGRTGQPYRLLSEAEWEYAARGGTTTRFPWGNDRGSNRANFAGNRDWLPVPAGSFEPNAFGLHDMIGNVEEWVQDCWNDTYKGAPTDGSAWEAGNCGRRVVRGGTYGTYPDDARAASRSKNGPGSRSRDLGFRVARTL